MTPIFILSLPRSGSTFLQRKLCNDLQLAYVPESWFLLESLALLHGEHKIRSIYGSHTVRSRLIELISANNNINASYISIIRDSFYGFFKALTDQNVIIDKVPRYLTYSKELNTVFPEAIFIILIRNPVHGLASTINEYSKGGFDWYDAALDYKKENIRKIIKYKESNSLPKNEKMFPKIIVIKYEDLGANYNDILNSVKSLSGISGETYFDNKLLISPNYNIGDKGKGFRFVEKKAIDISFVDYVQIQLYLRFVIGRDLYESLGYTWKSRMQNVNILGFGFRSFIPIISSIVRLFRDRLIYK